MSRSSEPEPGPLHVYRITLSNKVAMVLAGLGALGLSAYLSLGIADGLQSPTSADDASDFPWVAAIATLLLIAGVGLLVSAFRARLVLSDDRIQFPSTFGRKKTLLFAEIKGRRGIGRRMHFIRHDGRSLWLNETLFHLDTFYRDWLATIPDLHAHRHAAPLANVKRV